jgi:hypothetical protein
MPVIKPAQKKTNARTAQTNGQTKKQAIKRMQYFRKRYVKKNNNNNATKHLGLVAVPVSLLQSRRLCDGRPVFVFLPTDIS